MGLHMLGWVNSKGLDAFIALPKGFMVVLPAKHGLHLGDLTQ